MRRGWLTATAVMLLLCLFIMWQSVKLSLIDRLGPGPGFFPFWLGVIGAVLAVLIFVQTLRRPADGGDAPVFPIDREILLRMAAIVGITACAAAIMQIVGFRVSILLFAVAMVTALGARGWLAILTFGMIAGFGIFHVFNNWLDVILPQGLFEQLVGL